MTVSATKKYIEIMRERYNGCSDYRIAQLLGVTKSCVSRWANNKGGIGDEPAARLADLCDLDPVEVLTELYLERAKSRVTRDYFSEVLKRSRPVQVLVLSAFFLPWFYALQPFNGV